MAKNFNKLFIKKFAFEELSIFESPGNEGAVISSKSQSMWWLICLRLLFTYV